MDDPVDLNSTAADSGLGWRLEPKLHVGPVREVIGLSLGLVAAFVVSGIFVRLSGSSMLDAFRALLSGSFGSRSAVYETLVQATPLIFTGIAAAVAFRSRIWNIGGEGQFFAGAMGAYWMASQWGEGNSSAVVIPLVLVASAVTGAAWGAIPGFLKARYQTNEIITTVMMNFLILYVMSFLLSDLWRAPETYYYRTARLPKSASMPRLVDGSRLHWGIVLATVVALLIWWMISNTTFGYELRSLGVNRLASAYAGISVGRMTVAIMVLSGATAGMAGGVELIAIHHRLQMDMNTAGYGFLGIIVALLARLKPWAVIIAAIGFGGLRNGAVRMQIETGIPEALVSIIQGLTLLFVLLAAVGVRYELQRSKRGDQR